MEDHKYIPDEPVPLIEWLNDELRGIANEPRFLVENRAGRRKRQREQRRVSK